MSVIEIRKGEYVDPEPVEMEPGCVRLEPDSNAFRDYLLPRLEAERDDASKEVLESLRAGRHFGDAVLDAIESLPDSKTKKLKVWIEEARATRIYAYVDFSGLSRLTYGLMMTVGGPEDEILAHAKVGGYESDSGFAPYWEFRDAFKELADPGYAFDEVSLVDVSDEDEYNEALEALGIERSESEWKKPGLYNFQESPPMYECSVEDYESDSMKYEAERALEGVFDDDEWRETCETLLKDS